MCRLEFDPSTNMTDLSEKYVESDLSVECNKKANSKVKQMVEEAGCPFVNSRQLLVRNVCLMPNYQPNELPNIDQLGETKVDIYLHEAKILESN